MYTTYNSGYGLGYSRTVLSPARTYSTSYIGAPLATSYIGAPLATSYIGAPLATTTYGGVYPGIYGDAVTTTTVDPVFGSTVTRTFSPSRSYTTVVNDAPVTTTTTVDPVFGSTVTRTFSPSRSYTTVVNDAPLATVYDPVYDPVYSTYGPYGATTRTVNYF